MARTHSGQFVCVGSEDTNEAAVFGQFECFLFHELDEGNVLGWRERLVSGHHERMNQVVFLGFEMFGSGNGSNFKLVSTLAPKCFYLTGASIDSKKSKMYAKR